MATAIFRSLIAIAVLVATTPVADAQNAMPPGKAKVAHFVVGGAGGWDLLAFQAERQRLFISRSDRVQVFDGPSGKVIKEIPGTAGVHGIALANELGFGFATNGQSNSVAVFGLDSLRVVDQINGVGEKPDAILYDPVSKRVFAFGGRSHSATVIDAVNKRIVGTIVLPGKPELAVLDGKGSVFVNIEDKNSIARIDIAESTVTSVWPIGTCEGPTGLAIDTQHGRLFAVCGNRKMVIVDAGSGKVVSEVGIGERPDGAVFDSRLGLALSSNGDGTLSVIRQGNHDQYSLVATIATQKGARTMALDEATHRVYLVTSQFGPPPPASNERPHPRPSQIPGTFSVLVVDIGGLQ